MEFQKIKNYEKYGISRDGLVVILSKAGAVKPVTLYRTKNGYVVHLSSGDKAARKTTTITVWKLLGDTIYNTPVYPLDGDLFNTSVDNISTKEIDYFNTASTVIDGVMAKRVGKYFWVMEDGRTARYDPITTTYSIILNRKAKNYIYINVNRGGVVTNECLHRIVAELFVPNPNNYPIIDHKDENKWNNAASNLRWCTYAQNSEFYISANGANTRREANIKKAEKLKELEKKLREEQKYIKDLEKQLEQTRAALEAERVVICNHLIKEKEIINRNVGGYTGYANTTAAKFGSLAAMVKATGKPIVVNGKLYDSCGEAAAFIVASELSAGSVRATKATVSKELRRFLQGKRDQWMMYDKYTIGY